MYNGNGCFQPISIFLGSDCKPARLCAVKPGSCEIVESWLVSSSVGYLEQYQGKLAVPMVECTQRGWVFNHFNRLPLLDMWGNIVDDGLTVAVRTNYEGTPYIEYDEKDRVLVRDVYGRSKWCTEGQFTQFVKRNGRRNVFCNLDYDNFRLSNESVVISQGSLSSDLGLLAYQSSMLKFRFSYSGAIMSDIDDMIKQCGNIVQVPDNWVIFSSQWYDVFGVNQIIFPKSMLRLGILISKGVNLEHIVLPEVLHMPHTGIRHYITIMNCPVLEELVLPACRGSISIRISDCPRLRSIRAFGHVGYTCIKAQLSVSKCISLEEVNTPDYEYEVLDLDNTKHPKVVKRDTAEVVVLKLQDREVLSLRKPKFFE